MHTGTDTEQFRSVFFFYAQTFVFKQLTPFAGFGKIPMEKHKPQDSSIPGILTHKGGRK